MNSLTVDDPRLRILVCGYGRVGEGEWNYSEVSLPYWRLYWNPVPGARIWTNALKIDMGPSVAVLVAPNTVFSTENRKSIEHLYVHFQMPAFFVESKPPMASIPMADPLRLIARELAEGVASPSPSSRWRVSLTARSLVHLAMAKLNLKMTSDVCRDARVLNVLNYVDEHLQTDTSNEALARQAAMSVSALNRLFREQVGFSLQEYSRRKRIEKACLLLQFSTQSIEQVAEATGFCDRYHFSRIFKSIQGESPATFRRLHALPPAN